LSSCCVILYAGTAAGLSGLLSVLLSPLLHAVSVARASRTAAVVRFTVWSPHGSGVSGVRHVRGAGRLHGGMRTPPARWAAGAWGGCPFPGTPETAQR